MSNAQTQGEVAEAEALRLRMAEYAPRVPLLREVAARLDAATRHAIEGLCRIDRVSFREKDAKSFAMKSLKMSEAGEPVYERPLADIEDQVGGRVIVLFRRDIPTIVAKLTSIFTRVEQQTKKPKDRRAFAYESEHLVLVIPPQAYVPGWAALVDPPTTFEMQVRTIFMHAWAEPEHDILYKAKAPLSEEEERKIAWAASNAWGGDAIFEQVLGSIEGRTRDAAGQAEDTPPSRAR